jgi:hypothetical protein
MEAEARQRAVKYTPTIGCVAPGGKKNVSKSMYGSELLMMGRKAARNV